MKCKIYDKASDCNRDGWCSECPEVSESAELVGSVAVPIAMIRRAEEASNYMNSVGSHDLHKPVELRKIHGLLYEISKIKHTAI